MTAAAAAIDPDVISKAEFARRRNVSPGRVSQWISEGKIAGPAIVGEGRSAQIRESIACEQLRRKLDPMQMTANGLTTKLGPPPASRSRADKDQFDSLPLESSPRAVAAPLNPFGDSIEDKIKLQRLEQIERQNREGRRQEALDSGRLTDAAAAKAAASREAARLVTMFEGSLSNFATVIAAEFKLPQRDVLHLLRKQFRDLRAAAAAELRAEAQTAPALVEVDIGDTADQETDVENA